MQDLVCIRKFSDIREGQIAVNFLKSNGMDADLFHSGFVSYYGFELPSQARLMVPANQQEKALELLAQVQEEFNKYLPKRSLASNLLQYALMILSMIFLSITQYLGILVLGPISRFIRRIKKKR